MADEDDAELRALAAELNDADRALRGELEKPPLPGTGPARNRWRFDYANDPYFHLATWAASLFHRAIVSREAAFTRYMEAFTPGGPASHRGAGRGPRGT